MNKLSPKQEKFVQEYLKTGNATQSYISAGYSPNGADVSASRLLGNASIQQRLEELKKIGEEKFKIDKEFLAEKYLKLYELHEEGQGAVAKGSLDSLARMFGLDTKKIDVTTNGNSINIQIEKTYIDPKE